MKKHKNKGKYSKRELGWIISLIVGIGFLVYFFVPSYLNLQRYRKQNEAIDTRIKELEKENESLRAEIKKLKYDPLYIETIARKELGMMRPGETIYRIEQEEK